MKHRSQTVDIVDLSILKTWLNPIRKIPEIKLHYACLKRSDWLTIFWPVYAADTAPVLY